MRPSEQQYGPTNLSHVLRPQRVGIDELANLLAAERERFGCGKSARSGYVLRGDWLPMSTVKYQVQGASCQGCANAIKRAAASLSGVLHVDFDLNAKLVTVDYNETQVKPDAIQNRIEDAGYEAKPV